MSGWPEDLLRYGYEYAYIEVYCPACKEANWVDGSGYPPDDSAPCYEAIKCWNCGGIMACESLDLIDLNLNDVEEGKNWRDYISCEDGRKEP